MYDITRCPIPIERGQQRTPSREKKGMRGRFVRGRAGSWPAAPKAVILPMRGIEGEGRGGAGGITRGTECECRDSILLESTPGGGNGRGMASCSGRPCYVICHVVSFPFHFQRVQEPESPDPANKDRYARPHVRRVGWSAGWWREIMKRIVASSRTPSSLASLRELN